MLTEMFAYLCDNLAFYDGLTANEAYIRSALQVSAVRKLTGAVGYIPRPAPSPRCLTWRSPSKGVCPWLFQWLWPSARLRSWAQVAKKNPKSLRR